MNLQDVIKYFGKDKQMVVAIEEMAELTQQLSKHVIGHKNKSRHAVVEELVDVLLMLDQMIMIFDIMESEIVYHREKKLQRLHMYIAALEAAKEGDE